LVEHGLQLDDEEIEKLMQAYDSLSTFPDVGRALKKLSSNENIECVVFSNGTNSMVSNSVHRSKDLSPHSSLFKNIVTVEDVKRFKPAPEVYEHLAKCVGQVGREGEIWLISGNPFDIVGARAFGMQAAWVDRAGNGWQDKLGGQPTAILQTLEELERALQAHAK
jgi:2-haloacid dehalogenase